LKGLPLTSHPGLISGVEQAEDAGIFRLNRRLAIIQTVDFFTPIVDNPHVFGQIAATNALSDIYAMGGTPLTALNIACFPNKKMDLAVLREVLRGGLEKMHEAGVALVGGHTVDDEELKYGLAVTGTISPARIIHKRGARPGDSLLLTKPLGTGIISTAIKNGLASPASVDAISRSMTTLNRRAAEIMLEATVHACTDITGFGLLGHAAEMIAGTGTGIVFRSAAVPVFPETTELAQKGIIPGGLGRNRDFREEMVDIGEGVPRSLADVLYDPQTSGGLLIAIPSRDAAALEKRMRREGIAAASIIGEIMAGPERIRVT